MADDRNAACAARRVASLHPFARVGQCFLVGHLAHGHTVQADADARLVHHDEHGHKAAIGSAHEVADRTATVAVAHAAGGTGVNAELDRKSTRLNSSHLG